MLVTNKKLQEKAQKNKYAIGAFNVNNMEFVQAIVEAATELRSPVIIQATHGAIEYAGLDFIKNIVSTAESNSDIPIALHLDHGPDYQTAKKCIDIGFSSVMIDGSKLSFSENIRLTKKVVNYAHKKNVSVEAELGKLQGIEGKDIQTKESSRMYTDPQEAKEFCAKTGCDTLAIAIGTSHGAYKFQGKPELKFDILKDIRKKVKQPLVLHGASSVIPEYVNLANKFGAALKGAKGVPEDQITKAVKFGISKVNVDTDLRLAFTAAIRQNLTQNPSNFDPRKYLGAGREAVKQVVKQKIKVLKSVGKA